MFKRKKKEIAKQIGNLLANETEPLTKETFFLNTIATAECAITEMEELKSKIMDARGKITVNDMLLLSSEFELMYQYVTSIRHEYHL